MREVSDMVKSFSNILRWGFGFISSGVINEISILFCFFIGFCVGIDKFPFVLDLRGFIDDIMSFQSLLIKQLYFV